MNNRVTRLDFKKVFGTISKTPLIVTFLSGKGGVGKSVIAYNCAAMLADSGQRTLLIDADWDFGTQHLLANIQPRLTLAELIGEKQIGPDAMARSGNNLSIIPSPASRRTDVHFEPENYIEFIDKLKTNEGDFDFIIIDTPSSQLEIIKHSAASAAVNILVINPEITSMANSYGLFKFLNGTISGFNVHVLVNRVQFGKDSDYMYQKFAVLAERFIGKTPFYAGYLHESDAITESTSRQMGVSITAPDSESTAQILNLCKLLTEERAVKADNQTNTREKSINSRTKTAEIEG